LLAARRGVEPERILVIFLTSVNEGSFGMNWTAPILVEICIGLEINGYLPAEF
jgi:coenzyme PQQ precursor peptide PqqA